MIELDKDGSEKHKHTQIPQVTEVGKNVDTIYGEIK